MPNETATVLLLAEPHDTEKGLVILREGIVALARAVLARHGTLIVPAHPMVASGRLREADRCAGEWSYGSMVTRLTNRGR